PTVLSGQVDAPFAVFAIGFAIAVAAAAMMIVLNIGLLQIYVIIDYLMPEGLAPVNEKCNQ
ncbi:MAG: hypothetical protein AAFO75_13365, partial [Pseudomonadota bacterium]